MQKITIILLITTLTSAAHGQYIGFGFSSKGMGWTAGATVKNINLNVSADMPLIANDKPHNYGINAGYVIPLGEHTTITPTVGMALSKYKDYSKYDNEGTIRRVKDKVPAFTLEGEFKVREFGLFINARYSNGFYAGAGFKVHFN